MLSVDADVGRGALRSGLGRASAKALDGCELPARLRSRLGARTTLPPESCDDQNSGGGNCHSNAFTRHRNLPLAGTRAASFGFRQMRM